MLILLSLALIPGAATAATTFYVSSSSGNDSNGGTSKSSPWAHVPGMPGCTGSCASYTPQPGDKFIFMGGDVWKIAGAPWTLKGSGNSSSQIYYGVDPTWYNSSACTNWGTVNTYSTPPVRSDPSNVVLASATSYGFDNDLVGKTVTIGGSTYTVENLAFGGNREAMLVTPTPPSATGAAMTTSGIWCQPKIDFGFTATCNFPTQQGESCAGIDAANTSYVTFDDLDVGRYHPVNCNVGTCYRANAINVTTGVNAPAPGLKWTNNFFHDATAVDGTITTGSDNFWLGPAGDLNQGNTCSNQNNGLSYAAGNCFGATTNGRVLGNWCYRTNDCVDYSGPGIEVAYNVMYNGQDDTMDNGDHGNSIHAMCGPTYIHHNLIFDIGPNGAGMTTLMEPSEAFNSSCPNGGSQTYSIWDNVNFQASNGTCWVVYTASAGTTAVTFDFYNNTCIPSGTVVGTQSGDAIRVASATPMAAQINVVNMHVISAGWSGATTPINVAAATSSVHPCVYVDSGASQPLTVVNCVPQSSSSAISQGYVTSMPDNGHVLTANMLSPTTSTSATVDIGTNLTADCSGSLSTLCQALGILDLLNPGPSRPALGSWDAGAYQFAGTSASAPVPPTGLTATVN